MSVYLCQLTLKEADTGKGRERKQEPPIHQVAREELLTEQLEDIQVSRAPRNPQEKSSV